MSDLNAYGSVDHYKSWGSLRKQLQDLLCDSLKDKITYFYTNYHKRNNTGMYGRASVNFEKTELVSFSWDIFFDVQWKAESQTPITDKDRQRCGGTWEAQKEIHERLMREDWMPGGELCHEDFIHAATLFLKTDVAAALNSENYLLRMFAYLDRRVGKRMLIKIKDEAETLPEWVKQFYRIRCEAEGLSNLVSKKYMT